MCLAIFKYQKESNTPFILASNRDEFFERSTKEAHHWEDVPGVVAGKDLKAGGTWLGLNYNGDIAFLTNFRDPKYFTEKQASRGEIVSQFLEQNSDKDNFETFLFESADSYNGYNLIYGNPNKDLYYFSNVNKEFKPLDSGIYGLSNAYLDTPWPKLMKSKKRFQQLLEKEQNSEKLFQMLNVREIESDTDLPDTGVGLELERKLSSPFIEMDNYGTQCSTVIMYDNSEGILFHERTYKNPRRDYFDTLFRLAI